MLRNLEKHISMGSFNQIQMLNKKILIFVIGFFSFSVVFAQTPESENNVIFESNAEITANINKSIFYPGDPAIIFGSVDEYFTGLRVTILIMDESGQIRSEISAPVSKDGVFRVPNDIPETAKPGKYTVSITKGKDGVPVILKIEIKSITSDVFINIPLLSNNEESGMNFEPQSIIVKPGSTIVWENNDITIHTIVSGSKDSANQTISDGLFDSGLVSPKSNFKLALEEGHYEYFCRLHPWLTGTILASSSIEPSTLGSSKEEISTHIKTFSHYSLEEIENFSWDYDLCEFCIGAVSLSEDKKEGDSSLHLSVIGGEDASGTSSSFFLNFETVDIAAFNTINFWTKTKGNSADESNFLLQDGNGNQIGLGNFTSNSFSDWTKLEFSLSGLSKEDSNFNPESVNALTVTMPEGNLMKDKAISILIDDLYLSKDYTKPIEIREPVDEPILETDEPINEKKLETPELNEEQILAPLKQIKSGILAKNVVCKDGLELIIKFSDNSAACVSSNTALILLERGWAT